MRFFVLLFALASAVVGLISPAQSQAGFCCGAVPDFIITGTPTTTGTISTALTPFTVTQSGGAPPVTFSVLSGTLPTGVTFNATTGVFSGTPSQSGVFENIVLQAEDSASPGAHRIARLNAFTLTIQSPASDLTVSGTPTTTATVGTLMTPFTVTASGGTGPYTYAVTAGYLPSGVSLGASTGVVSGTPATDYDGTYTRITITATDTLAHVGNLAAFQIVVQPANPKTIATITSNTPVPYIRNATLASGTIFSLHGLSMGHRQSTNSQPSALDADGNYDESMWYTGNGWPDTCSQSPADPACPPPLTVNEFSEYPFRIGSTPAPQVRGGRVIGTVSASAETINFELYPYDATAGTGIVTPGALPACYNHISDYDVTWVNINATGTSGTSSITSTAPVVNQNRLFVGEEISTPENLTQAIQTGTTITGFTSSLTFTISLPLIGNVTKVTYHGCTATYQNSAAYLMDVVKPANVGSFTLTKVRADHVWDGVRSCAQVVLPTQTCTGTISEVWLSYARDDAFESDNGQNLNITDVLVDGTFSFISSVNTVDARASSLVYIDGAIVRIEDVPNFDTNQTPPYDAYGVPFKWVTFSPYIDIRRSVIAVDGADDSRIQRYIEGWSHMQTGTGGCNDKSTNSVTGLVGNYFLWLGDDTPTTAQIGDMADPTSTVRVNCFTYQQGATARATWAAAKLAEQLHLGSLGVYRLSSDP